MAVPAAFTSQKHTHAQRTWTWLATWMPRPSPAPAHGAQRGQKCRLLLAGTGGQEWLSLHVHVCAFLKHCHGPSAPSTPAQIAGLLLSPQVSHLLTGSAWGLAVNTCTPYTQSLGRIQTFTPGNQPHFKQDWPLVQPTLSTPLLCSSPTSPPAHPPCICTAGNNQQPANILSPRFTFPTAAKSRFACGFSAAHQFEK